jgi:hypothetical protein
MSVKKSDLATLKQKLPAHYSNELQKRLKKKYGVSYKPSYIRKGLTFNHLKMIFFDEAMLYVDDLTSKSANREKRLNRWRG